MKDFISNIISWIEKRPNWVEITIYSFGLGLASSMILANSLALVIVGISVSLVKEIERVKQATKLYHYMVKRSDSNAVHAAEDAEFKYLSVITPAALCLIVFFAYKYLGALI